MEHTHPIYERAKQKDQQTHHSNQKNVRDKYNLILKNRDLKLSLHETYIEVDDGVLSQIYGVLNIQALYIHNAITLSIADCYAISKYLKIYFIDARGNVVGEYIRSKIL